LEVLVVIPIIAIIAANLFSVFSRGKKRANEMTCISNLRQIHAALTLYRIEYDGDGVYRSHKQMGLPHPRNALSRTSGVDPSLRVCTGQSFPPEVHQALYHTMWSTIE
jgi:type II secretory pathway pseudopilin PulG